MNKLEFFDQHMQGVELVNLFPGMIDWRVGTIELICSEMVRRSWMHLTHTVQVPIQVYPSEVWGHIRLTRFDGSVFELFNTTVAQVKTYLGMSAVINHTITLSFPVEWRVESNRGERVYKTIQKGN